MLQDAKEAWKTQDFQKCIDILERASRLDHANVPVLLDLGRAYGMRYDYAAAERTFEKAVRVSQRRADALTMAGMHSRDFGRFEMAGRYLERAAEQPGASPDTLVQLAELYERLRRLEDASRLIDRALHLDGASAFTLLARARLDRLSGRLEEAERVLRSFLNSTDANTWSTRIRGWYELGSNLDRQGRYDEAMAAFVEAKALLTPGATPYSTAQQTFHAYMKEAEATITADVLRRWFDAGQALQPPRRLALLCGHPRSGTTLLEQVLDSHPDIVSAEETQVFRDDAYFPFKRDFQQSTPMLTVLDSMPLNALEQSRENYFRCMELFLGNPISDRLLIDKNPSLTTLIPAAIRIFPEMKFIVALRDPRDVCLSCFMQPLPLNQVSSSYLSLEDTFEEYASLMGFWRAIAPRMRNPCIEVRYEDVVSNLEPVSRRVLEFFGVPWDATVLRFDEHARKKLVRSPTYADVTKPLFKGAVGRWRNYQKHLEPWLKRLDPFVKAFGYE